MQGVCLRDDIYDVMIWQTSCASCEAIAGHGNQETEEETPLRTAMQLMGFNLMIEPAFLEVAKHQYCFEPLANTFTLGIYGMVSPANGFTE